MCDDSYARIDLASNDANITCKQAEVDFKENQPQNIMYD